MTSGFGRRRWARDLRGVQSADCRRACVPIGATGVRCREGRKARTTHESDGRLGATREADRLPAAKRPGGAGGAKRIDETCERQKPSHRVRSHRRRTAATPRQPVGLARTSQPPSLPCVLRAFVPSRLCAFAALRLSGPGWCRFCGSTAARRGVSVEATARGPIQLLHRTVPLRGFAASRLCGCRSCGFACGLAGAVGLLDRARNPRNPVESVRTP